MENNLHKRDFSEEDSPIPVIPTDAAWEAMRHQLDEGMPQKKKRRFLYWIFPIGCTALLLCILALSGLFWWHFNHKSSSGNSNRSHGSDIHLPEAKTNDEKINRQQQPKRNITGNIPEKNQQKKNDRSRIHLKNTALRIASDNETTLNNPSWRQDVQNYANPDDNSLAYSLPQRTSILPYTAAVRMPVTAMVHSDSNQPAPSTFKKKKNAFSFSAGLQWQVPVPLNGTDYFLKGSNGRSQFYQLLLPAGWIAASFKKHHLTLEVAPFHNMLMPANNFYTATSPAFDDITSKSLVKVFGARAGLQYGYQFASQWRIQGGVYGNWWHKGLVAVTKLNDSSANGRSTYSVSIRPRDEQRFRPFQPSAGIAINYQHGALEGLLQVERPFSETLKGVHAPVLLSVMLRWRLWNSK